MALADDGILDEKGHWRPDTPCAYSPLFTTPWKIGDVMKWLFAWGG